MILAGKLLFLVVTFVALAGCGGDGAGRGHSGPETAEFDLTGMWETTESECRSYSDELSESELAQVDPGVLAEGEEELGSEIVQSGNSLEITDFETGQVIEGTISGKRIDFEASFQLESDGVETDLSLIGEGESRR